MTRPAEHALITQLLDETRTLAREVFKDSCNHTKDAVEFFHAEMGVRVHEYLAAPEVEKDCEHCKHVNSPSSQNPCNGCMDSTDYHSFEADSPFCTKCGSTGPAPVVAKSTEPVNQQLLKALKLTTNDLACAIESEGKEPSLDRRIVSARAAIAAAEQAQPTPTVERKRPDDTEGGAV